MTKAKSRNDAQVSVILAAIRDWQDAREAFDEAMAGKLGLIVAERRCLTALVSGPKAAGILAQASGLTPAAATSMIDRLEKRGFVERQRDETDRRKVFVALTQPAKETLRGYYEPGLQEFETQLAAFSPDELSTIERFAAVARDLQQAGLERVRNEPAK